MDDKPIRVFNWKYYATRNPLGYYDLQTEDIGDTPVRLFFSEALLDEAEDGLYQQIVNATRFPGVKLVVITPDAHFGYGVPVGSVILTDGTIAMGPIGFDIGCFTADTLVPTVDGHSYPIGELAASGQELLVYALGSNQKIVVAKATARQTRANAPLVKVLLDNDREIICTPDHEFMLRDGAYRQAQELIPGASLMPFRSRVDRDGYTVVKHPGSELDERIQEKTVIHCSFAPTESMPESFAAYNHKVVSVEPLDYRADVYCLSVPGYNNFALDAGVFVHNCGMLSARSDVPVGVATREKRLAFNKAVIKRIAMGAGGTSKSLGRIDEREFERLVRGGADYYIRKYNATGLDRSNAERNVIPVDDDWVIPFGGKGKPERGMNQLGSLGGGEMVASQLQ